MRGTPDELVTSAADAAIPDAPAAQVPPELRRFVREQQLARPSTAKTVVHLAVIVAAWVALALVGFAADSLAMWLVVWVALGVLTASPLALMHEAVHHNLFRARAANHVIGTVAAMVLFFHAPAYRAWHLTHHAYTFEPQDSEQLPARFTSRLAYLGYALVLGPSFAVILWLGAITTVAGRPPRWIGTKRLQRHVRRWAIAPAAIVAVSAIALLAWPAIVIKAWLIPSIVGSLVVFPIVSLPEHYEGKGRSGLLNNTRTSVSNPVFRYVYWNNNFHTAHHLVPTVPPHSLSRVDAEIESVNTLRERGFLALHRRVLANLPWV